MNHDHSYIRHQRAKLHNSSIKTSFILWAICLNAFKMLTRKEFPRSLKIFIATRFRHDWAFSNLVNLLRRVQSICLLNHKNIWFACPETGQTQGCMKEVVFHHFFRRNSLHEVSFGYLVQLHRHWIHAQISWNEKPLYKSQSKDSIQPICSLLNQPMYWQFFPSVCLVNESSLHRKVLECRVSTPFAQTPHRSLVSNNLTFWNPSTQEVQ